MPAQASIQQAYPLIPAFGSVDLMFKHTDVISSVSEKSLSLNGLRFLPTVEMTVKITYALLRPVNRRMSDVDTPYLSPARTSDRNRPDLKP